MPKKSDGPVTVLLEQFVEAEPIIEGKDEAGGTSLEEKFLASSWEEAKDPNTGVIYYYNSETGATQWDKPNTNKERHQRTEDETSINLEEVNQKNESTPSAVTPAAIIEAKFTVSDVVEEEALDESSSLQEDTLATGSLPVDGKEKLPAALPHPWEEAVDETSGKVYYSNAETGVRQWDQPVAETVEIDSVNEAGDDSVLEKETVPFWEEITDPASNMPYYYNSATGVTQWDKPEELSASIEKQKDQSPIKNISTDIGAEKPVSVPADESPSKPVSHSKYIFTIELHASVLDMDLHQLHHFLAHTT